MGECCSLMPLLDCVVLIVWNFIGICWRPRSIQLVDANAADQPVWLSVVAAVLLASGLGYVRVPLWWLPGLIPLGPRVIRSRIHALLKKHLAISPMAGLVLGTLCLILAADASFG
ncbi:hypothetical protein Nepgr_027181 [Nepenthes gracilis]|uniref:Uncharacterized protein n=1 Tax=Nepenthes gracilis TaxID=150966 RepID=A0AAD3T8H5_NEPGR|nr:hypothetical protein Nepgr_027181 [Nepenthes gracilis]